MTCLKSHRFSRAVAILGIAAATLLPASLAFARSAPINFGEFDLETILNDPLGLLIGAGLFLALLIGGIIYYSKSPTFAEIERRREKFWQDLPSDGFGYKGVLYTDEILGAHFGAGPYIAHRIQVELKHEDPSKSKILFRNKEQPNKLDMSMPSKAMKLWIDMAREHGLPAVYTTRHGIHRLDQASIAEMDENPESFIKKLQAHLTLRKPLPAA